MGSAEMDRAGRERAIRSWFSMEMKRVYYELAVDFVQ